MAKPDDLIAYLFDRGPHPLAGELVRWLEGSPRFADFAETYRDKIRKKLRFSRERENALDLRGELEAAYCLLSDRRFALRYEPYASAKRRGPDLAVTYRANLVFNIEIARIRAAENGARPARSEERVVRILLDKLEQMQPGMPNLLVIRAGEDTAQSIRLDELMQAVKTRVEGKDPAFFAFTRFTSPTSFYREFLHLSGILLWAEPAQLWANKQARPALDGKVLRLAAALLAGADTV